MAKTTQTQTTKPATKPATGRTKPAKAAVAPQTETQAAPAQVLAYAVRDGFRPSSGSLLFAYTAAWMALSGMADGKPVAGSLVSKVAGGTARKYHTDKTGAFAEDSAGNVTLTEAGRALFAKRKPEAKHVEAYRAVLATGALDPAVGVKVAGAVVKLS